MIREELPLSGPSGSFKGHMFKSVGPDYSDPYVSRILALMFEGGVVYCMGCHGVRSVRERKMQLAEQLIIDIRQDLEVSCLYRLEGSKWSEIITKRVEQAEVGIGLSKHGFETSESLKHYVFRTKDAYLHVLCERLVSGPSLVEFRESLAVRLLLSKIVL